MRESRGGVFQGRFHNLLISKNNTFWAPQISRITFQVVMVKEFNTFSCRECREARGLPTHRWPAPGRRPPRLTAADGSSGCLEAQRVKFLPKKCSTEVA